MIKPHQQLDVWKRSFAFVTKIYALTNGFPADEKFGLTSQIRRAAVSVPVNIAEGAARKSKKEFVQFLHISLGSASELDTLILLCGELKLIDPKQVEQLNEDLHVTYKMLRGLINRNKSLYE